MRYIVEILNSDYSSYDIFALDINKYVNNGVEVSHLY